MSARVSAWRAAVLLSRLRWRRQLNQLGASLARVRARQVSKKTAARTSPVRWVLGALFAAFMLVGSAGFANEAMLNMERVLGSTLVRNPSAVATNASRSASVGQPQFVRRQVPPAPGTVLAPGVVQGATLAVSLLMALALLLALAGREFALPEWDLEWLVTLPLPLPTLLASRVIERVVTNASGFVALVPFLSVLAWSCGYRWAAPVLGFAIAVVLLFAVATVQTFADTGLRLSLPPHRLRNAHALVSIASLPVLFAAVSMGLPDYTFMLDIASALPGWVRWSPPGLAVEALASADVGSALLWSGLMVIEIVLFVLGGVWLLGHQLRNGIVSVGVRESVARRPAAERPVLLDSAGARSLLSPLQRREFQLLARDRTFMVQTLVMPLTIVGMQLLLNAHTDIFAGAVNAPATLAVIAFGLATYTLMFSAFQTLNAEGQSLWILYCIPHSLESVLRQKAALWSAVAMIYPLALFAAAVMMAGGVSPAFLGSAAIVLIGVPIFATIATALGVFGCDPLAQEIRRRVRPTYLYLYMVLVSLYGYAIFAGSIWQRAALMVLTALLAIALWQKARDQLPYLLDPSASPPARVSVSDGLIAALLFFVLQALIAGGEVAFAREHTLTVSMVWIAFCGAGAVTYGVMRFVYWRAHTAGVPRIWGAGVSRALVWGAAGGVAAALVGFAYIEIAVSFDLFPALRRAGEPADARAALWLAAMAIAAAPIFEEFIFRGLIYGGLRRSFGLVPAALASAAIFAIVHPPASVIPVFAMALCAALAYERTSMLAAPMIVHAIYNAVVLGLQWNMMQPS